MISQLAQSYKAWNLKYTNEKQHNVVLFHPIDTEYANVQEWKENLCESRLKICAKTKTDPWTIEDLEIALKDLKNGTSRDPYGYANELFKTEVAGHDLKLSIVKLVN